MVDHLQSRVTPWRQYASYVKVRGTLSKMDVQKKAIKIHVFGKKISVTPWRQYASYVKVRGTLSKMDVQKKAIKIHVFGKKISSSMGNI